MSFGGGSASTGADLTFKVGASGTLTASYFSGSTREPDPALTTWRSSNPAVISVTSTGPDTAHFICHKAGLAALMVSVPASKDSQNSYSAFFGTKTVLVKR